MISISTNKFLLWKEKQISKGGDYQALSLLIDTLGGVSNKELSFLKIKSEKNVELKVNLDILQ